jgi:hypothetical protein
VYGTIILMVAYATTRGITVFADATDAQLTAVLTRASDYVKYRYVAFFIGGYDDTLPIVEEAAYLVAIAGYASPRFFEAQSKPAQTKTLSQVGKIRWQPQVSEMALGYDGQFNTLALVEAMFDPYIVKANASKAGFWVIGPTT